MNIKFASLFLICLLYYSCDDDESSDLQNPGPSPNPDPKVEVAIPVITSVSPSFIKIGETLTIEGNNLTHDDFGTTLIINDTSYEVTPNSNNQITIDIPGTIGIEKSTVSVRVSDKASKPLDFFIVPRGWYKIDLGNTTYHKSFVFENSNNLFTLSGEEYSVIQGEEEYPVIQKITAGENGYSWNTSNFFIYSSDLKMVNENIAAATIGYSSYISTDGFESAVKFGDYGANGEYSEPGITDGILYLSDNECISTNRFGAHFYTNDYGATFSYSSSPTFMSSPANQFRGQIKSMGKGSDGYFYEIGFIDYSNNHRNLVMKSSDYRSWQVVDSLTAFNANIYNCKFFDYNLILSKNSTNQLVKSTDLAKSWTSIKDDISNFFIESLNKWYVISGNNLLVSEDSGLNWNLELELPPDAVVNHMSFTTSKIILSGENGLLYIKHK